MSSSEIGNNAPIGGTDILVPEPEPDHEFIVSDGLWDKLRTFAGRIPFADDVLAAWFCTRDPLTPARVKAILIAAIAYFVLPLDAIPDFIPGLGFTDDAAVIAAVLSMIRNHITPAHRLRAAETLHTLTARKRQAKKDEEDQ